MKTQEENLDCPFDFTSRCTLGRCDCKSKQETLEEAAEKYDENDPNDEYGKSYRSFIEGAKWQQEQEKITTDDAYNEGFENGKHSQQERSYSEEEVHSILNSFKSLISSGYNKPYFDWFEQFKKEVI